MLAILVSMRAKFQLISVVVPVFNEAKGLDAFHTELNRVLQKIAQEKYEVIYCDDGSYDTTNKLIKHWCDKNPKIKLVTLARNFGKEIAVSAGLSVARGQAVITLDADGQHPVSLIPEFIKRWQNGSSVVIGLRTSNKKEGFIKKYGSKLFYGLFNRVMNLRLVPGATDFRLVDAVVLRDFLSMTERNRITRGMVDWLGYKKEYIEFNANPRLYGQAGYSFKKLFKLAIDSMISLSISPLYIAMYLGAIILPVSTVIGIAMLANEIAGDPLNWNATGSAYLMVLLLFLVGVILVSQGIIGLYLSHIHTETQNRPLFVIDQARSVGINEN
jgi:glycosyltransferase involved in cell wall biosynthesis